MAGEYPRIGEFHRTRSHPDARPGTRSTAHRIAKDRNRDGDRSRRREQEASGSHIIHFRTSDQRRRCGVRKEAARGNRTGAYRVQGPRRRYGWRCNPIGYQPNYTHIPNEKAWNLREAVFLKSVCAAPGYHLVGALCRIVGFPWVRPVKLLKMIVWRGGTRSDR